MGLFSKISKGIGSIFGGPGGAVLGQLGGGLIEGVFNAKSASKNRAFQASQSGSAHQREVADLKAAGLNPILSSRYGGSSTGPGSAASIRNPAANLPAALSTAIQAKRVKAEISNLDAQTALNAEKINTEQAVQAQNYSNSALSLERVKSEMAGQGFTKERTVTQAALTKQEQVRVSTAMAQLGKTRMESIKAEAEADRAVQQGKIDQSNLGEFLAWLQRAKELGIGLDQVMYMLRRRKKLPGGKQPNFPQLTE
ncbi:DNA pilot protein [Microviridae sp.]|nr:DNA pilot protein [Microviridae sp.]